MDSLYFMVLGFVLWLDYRLLLFACVFVQTWCRLSTICLPLRIVALELIFRSFNGVLYCVWVWNLLCVKLEYLG